jgi:hypothetical protein
MFKMWRWKAIELSRETEMDYTDEFDIARKAWPGIKRGLETELKCLKKHKDWRKVTNKSPQTKIIVRCVCATLEELQDMAK